MAERGGDVENLVRFIGPSSRFLFSVQQKTKGSIPHLLAFFPLDLFLPIFFLSVCLASLLPFPLPPPLFLSFFFFPLLKKKDR